MDKSNIKRGLRRSAVLLLALVLLVVFLNSIYVVQPNKYGILRQFGAVVDVKDQPGLYFKVPFIQDYSTLPHTVLPLDDFAAPAAEKEAE